MIYQYTLIQWLFFFYLYSFFGWCFESTYVSVSERKPVNRGFMKGPFLPLYGTGAIMMLLVSKPFEAHWWAVYIAGCVGATILEYITGVVMEGLFKVRYWDYSHKPLHFRGYICLESSLVWGVLTLLITYVIHQPIANMVFLLKEKYLNLITILLTFYIVGDFTLSFRAALDLKDILVHMEKAKENLVRVQKRLETILALAGEKKFLIADKLKIEDIKDSIEKMLGLVKDNLHKRTEDYSEGTKKELLDLHTEYTVNKVKHESFKKSKGLIRRIRNNPTMSSARYKEALDELKEQADEKNTKLETHEKTAKK